MKNLFFIISIFSLLFVACNDENLITDSDTPSNKEVNNGVLKSAEVINGTLHFEENIYDVLDAISKMTDQELDVWEKSMGFTSYRTIINNIYKETSWDENFQDSQLLTMYPDYFIEKNGNIEPAIRGIVNQTICNAKGEYYVTGNYHKVLPDAKIIIRDVTQEKINLALQKKETIEEQSIYYLDEKDEVALKYTSGYPNPQSEPYREGNYRIVLEIKINLFRSMTYTVFTERYEVSFTTSAERKGKGWETGHWVSDFGFTIYAPKKNGYHADYPEMDYFLMQQFTYSGPTYFDLGRAKKHTRSFYIGDEIKTPMQFGYRVPTPTAFVRVKGKSTISPISGYAIINKGY